MTGPGRPVGVAAGTQRGRRTWFAGAAVALFGLYFAAAAPSPLLAVDQAQWHFPAWQLTLAFAVYPLSLLVTLLTVGSLSDHVGRRPVIVVALLAEIAGLTTFALASDVGLLIAGRVVQGMATGAAMGALSAAVVDLAPRPRVGGLLGSIAPLAGLSAGSLITGLLLAEVMRPGAWILGLTNLVFVLCVAAAVVGPETSPAVGGALRSLRPSLRIPPGARAAFGRAVPAYVAGWVLGGINLGLGPLIVREIFGYQSGLVAGASAALTTGVAAIAAFVLRDLPPAGPARWGLAAIGLAAVLIVISIPVASIWIYLAGFLVGGIGFGAAFAAAIALTIAGVANHERGSVFSSVYVVCYLAFGVPAILAGLLAGPLGLPAVTVGYATLVVVVAAVGLGLRARPRFADPAPR